MYDQKVERLRKLLVECGLVAALEHGNLDSNCKKLLTVDDVFIGTVNTDTIAYEFDKSFPEIMKHEKACEAEIAKLIGNINMDV